jgi:hypothetical protein
MIAIKSKEGQNSLVKSPYPRLLLPADEVFFPEMRRAHWIRYLRFHANQFLLTIVLIYRYMRILLDSCLEQIANKGNWKE